MECEFLVKKVDRFDKKVLVYILSFTAKTRKPLLYKEMRVFCILCNIQNFQYFKIFLIFSLGMYFLSESLRLY